MSTNFDPELHTFRSPKFKSVVEDALRFFGSTPAHPLPPPQRFAGAGVYAFYYSGEFELYQGIAERNKDTARQPIYVGKAVPPGSRTGMSVRARETADLFRRLREHTLSLTQAENLKTDDFCCRFMVLNGVERDLIAPVESALIRRYRPLWNANILSGFGIHTPGKGRFEQRRSRWDVLHPGRPWASRMKNLAASEEEIIADVRRFFNESALS
jgi:hypothetical protein